MSSVVFEVVKTVGIESAVFGIGNIAQSFSSSDNIVSFAFLGAGVLVCTMAIIFESKTKSRGP